jgi:hypothetical protein
MQLRRAPAPSERRASQSAAYLNERALEYLALVAAAPLEANHGEREALYDTVVATVATGMPPLRVRRAAAATKAEPKESFARPRGSTKEVEAGASVLDAAGRAAAAADDEDREAARGDRVKDS